MMQLFLISNLRPFLVIWLLGAVFLWLVGRWRVGENASMRNGFIIALIAAVVNFLLGRLLDGIDSLIPLPIIQMALLFTIIGLLVLFIVLFVLVRFVFHTDWGSTLIITLVVWLILFGALIITFQLEGILWSWILNP